MLESNPPRNTRPPTHRDDERRERRHSSEHAASLPAFRKPPDAHRIDRLAHA